MVHVVKDCGADPGGIFDSTDAINRAFDSGDPHIEFGAGTFRVGPLNSPPQSALLQGIAGRTFLMANQATGDILPLANLFIVMDGIGFSSAVPRTGGCYFRLSSSYITVRNFSCEGAYTAFQVDDNTSVVSVTGGQPGFIYNSVGAGQGVVIWGSGTGVPVIDGYFGQCVVNSNSANCINIQMINVADLVMEHVQSLLSTWNMAFMPGTGQQVTCIKTTGSFCDTAIDINLLAAPTGTGVVQMCVFTGHWFGTAGVNSILMQASGSAMVDEMRFVGCEILNATKGNGVAMVGNVKNVKLIGNLITVNDVGVYDNRAAGYDGVIVMGNTIGQAAGFPGNKTGIVLAGAGDNSVYSQNTVLGNQVAAFSNSNTGLNNAISANPGIAAVAVGA